MMAVVLCFSVMSAGVMVNLGVAVCVCNVSGEGVCAVRVCSVGEKMCSVCVFSVQVVHFVSVCSEWCVW